MSDPNEPVAPIDEGKFEWGTNGLTKLELFTLVAMHAYCSMTDADGNPLHHDRDTTTWSIATAKAQLAALEKEAKG